MFHSTPCNLNRRFGCAVAPIYCILLMVSRPYRFLRASVRSHSRRWQLGWFRLQFFDIILSLLRMDLFWESFQFDSHFLMIGFRPFLILLLGSVKLEQIYTLGPHMSIVMDWHIIVLKEHRRTIYVGYHRLVMDPPSGIAFIPHSYLGWHVRIGVLLVIVALPTRCNNRIKGDFTAIHCCIRSLGALTRILPKNRQAPYF